MQKESTRIMHNALHVLPVYVYVCVCVFVWSGLPMGVASRE